MVARDPLRPKAADISDLTAMRCVEDYCVSRGPYPIDALVERGFPKNLAGAKLHKLARRGWISLQYKLLRPGADFLRDSDEPAMTVDELAAHKGASRA